MTGARRGRPRSEETRRAILAATRDVVSDSGYDTLTFDAVARLAGCSRQTLYRWWPSKAMLVSDAVVEGFLVMPRADDAALADTGDLAADLTSWLQGVLERAQDPLALSLIRAFASASAEDGHRAEALYATLTGVQHAALVARIDAARAAGDLPERIDPPSLADAILGLPVFHALIPRRASVDAAVIVRTLLG